MKLSNLIIISTTPILLACNQIDKSDTISKDNKSDNISSCNDSANAEIYYFINVVRNDHILDTTYGLDESPLKNFEFGESDSSFLQRHLLIDDHAKAMKGNSSNVMTLGTIDSCLTQEDIWHMLSQKARNANFKWNSHCVHLNTNKFGEKYVFSLPLFSKDKTKFLVTIENFNAGGIILLYKRQNNSWTSTTELEWIH